MVYTKLRWFSQNLWDLYEFSTISKETAFKYKMIRNRIYMNLKKTVLVYMKNNGLHKTVVDDTNLWRISKRLLSNKKKIRNNKIFLNSKLIIQYSVIYSKLWQFKLNSGDSHKTTSVYTKLYIKLRQLPKRLLSNKIWYESAVYIKLENYARLQQIPQT